MNQTFQLKDCQKGIFKSSLMLFTRDTPNILNRNLKSKRTQSGIDQKGSVC